MIKLTASVFIALNVFLITLGFIPHSPPGMMIETIGLAFCLNFLVIYYVLEIEVKRILGVDESIHFINRVKDNHIN